MAKKLKEKSENLLFISEVNDAQNSKVTFPKNQKISVQKDGWFKPNDHTSFIIKIDEQSNRCMPYDYPRVNESDKTLMSQITKCTEKTPKADVTL